VPDRPDEGFPSTARTAAGCNHDPSLTPAPAAGHTRGMDKANDYVERGLPSWWLRMLEPTDRS
jgi:hypothetical protein